MLNPFTNKNQSKKKKKKIYVLVMKDPPVYMCADKIFVNMLKIAWQRCSATFKDR